MIATSEIAYARHRLSKSQSFSSTSFKKHQLHPLYEYKTDVVKLDRDGREVYVRVTVRWMQRGKPVEEIFETIVLLRR